MFHDRLNVTHLVFYVLIIRSKKMENKKCLQILYSKNTAFSYKYKCYFTCVKMCSCAKVNLYVIKNNFWVVENSIYFYKATSSCLFTHIITFRM